MYWEDVEPRVAEAVRRRIGEFQEAGIGGIDLYLASFGPALQVFSESWPLTRGRPVVRANGKSKKAARPEDDDPYAVRPEDALDAARREVKRWRLGQLSELRQRYRGLNLDPLTEWYALAWDAFKAPRFPVDEALKLARVVGLDFDREVKNVACESKGSDVTLWDSLTRRRKGKLGPVGGPVVLDTLHQAAATRPRAEHRRRGRRPGVGRPAGPAGLDDGAGDPAQRPAAPRPGRPGPGRRGRPGRCRRRLRGAWRTLRRLAFAETVPAPHVQMELTFPVESQGTLGFDDASAEGEGEEDG